jgi:hypothetical protein
MEGPPSLFSPRDGKNEIGGWKQGDSEEKIKSHEDFDFQK